MKKQLSFLLVLLSTLVANSQNLSQYTSQGKLGLKDSSEKIISPAIYDEIWELDSNFYVVTSNEKSGVIDTKGNVIVALKYKEIDAFSDGIFIVNNNDNLKSFYGAVDLSGKEILKPIYTKLQYFNDGIFLAQLDKKWTLIDKLGKVIVNFENNYEYLNRSKNGMMSGTKDFKKYCVINKQGQEITDYIYDDSIYFSEDVGRVEVNNKYGYIDILGNSLIPAIYDQISEFYEGTAIVKLNKEVLIIDKKGKKIKTLPFTNIGYAFEDVVNLGINGKYGRNYRATGNSITPAIYDVLPRFQFDGTTLAGLNGKFGMMDKLGKIIIPIQFDQFSSTTKYKRQVLTINNKSILYNMHNKKQLTEIQYDSIGNFKEGFALVKKEGKFGFIDKLGNEFIESKFRYASEFSEGKGIVLENDRWFFFDNKANFSFIRSTTGTSYNFVAGYKDGLCHVILNNKSGFINEKMEVVIPLIYDSCSNFSDGLSVVKLNSKFGFIDKIGKVIIPLKYDELYYLDNDVIKATIGSEEFYYNRRGNKINKPTEE